jgi:hypothetical protein
MENQNGRIGTLSSKFNSFTQARVDQLRKALVEDFGYEQFKVDSIKGKKELVNLYQMELKRQHETAKLADAGGVGSQFPKLEPLIPTTEDPGWTDWVLDQLTEDERIDGYPKSDGLRRLTEKIVGTIVYQDTDVCHSPNMVNGMCATVKHVIRLLTDDGDTLQFCGAVDVNQESLTRPFSIHLVATAETKAESRAFRRALKIKTNTAEEMGLSGSNGVKIEDEEPITIESSQIQAIHLLSKRLDINVEKFLEQEVQKTNLEKLSYLEATKCCKALGLMQIKRDIPDEIKGYVQQ